jgi:plastocyanin
MMIPARLRLPALVLGTLAATATLAACGGTSAATTPSAVAPAAAASSSTSMSMPMPQSPVAAQTAPAATDHVAISGFAFSPATVTVKVGTTVTWTQQDEDQHTVTANDGSFGSSPLVTGTTYTHTFSAPGTYQYHCSIHPFMHGTVVVTNG